MQLSVAVDAFIASACAGKTNETPKAYRTKLQRLIESLGSDVQLESIKSADLERFRLSMLTQRVKRRGHAEIAEPLSVWYIRGVLRTVKQFFKWCAESELLPVNISAKLKIPPKPQVLPKAVEAETFDKLLKAAAVQGDAWARPRDVAFLCLLRDTGGRVSGLLKARVTDLDMKVDRLDVTEKGDKRRSVFFNDASHQALESWLEVRTALKLKSDALFVGRVGKALTRSGVYRMFARLKRAAGLAEGVRFNPHSFRHAFARDSLRAGADLSEVSQMMGHSGIAVTADYYARWLPNELQAVHRRTSPGARVSLPV